MSFNVIRWALEQPVARPSAKLVLVVMADYADDNGTAFPSVESLHRHTNLNRKTILAAIRQLRDAGFIEDTGVRRGRTGQVVVYRLPVTEQCQKRAPKTVPEPDLFNGAESGPVTEVKESQKRIQRVPKSALKESQNRDTEPVSEPVKELSSLRSDSSFRGFQAQQAVDLWNAFAAEHGLSRVAKLTAARRSALNARLQDCGGMEGWQSALNRIRGSPFLLGDNDRGWKANFDFLIRESSFTKLMEGAYERAKGRTGTFDLDAIERAAFPERYADGRGEAGGHVRPQDDRRRIERQGE